MKFMTIGYEGYTIDSFFNVLTSSQVQTLVDVRELPISRKPGFSKTALQQFAQARNIAYVHIRVLGCPRVIRHDYRADKDWQKFSLRYNEYLDTQDNAIAELIARMKEEQCCLLCMEANHNFCHRSLVAKRIVKMFGDDSTSCIHLQLSSCNCI